LGRGGDFMRIILLLFALSLVLIGCGDKPPMPKLSVNHEKIDFELGSYFTKSFAKTVNSDSAAPPMLVKGLEPKTVVPESSLLIEFNKKPKKIIISEWKDGKEGSQTTLEFNKFQLPKEKGTYIYSIRSEWKNGSSGTYAFVIKVE